MKKITSIITLVFIVFKINAQTSDSTTSLIFSGYVWTHIIAMILINPQTMNVASVYV